MRPAPRAALALAAALLVAAPAANADITVTTVNDGLVADARCSLREALEAARLDTPYLGCAPGFPGLDTVVLGAGTYTLSLPGYEDLNVSGDLDVGPTQAVRITGAGAASTIIDADGQDRAFDVSANGVLSLEDLTVRGGRAQPGGFGGGVRNAGRLFARRVVFTDNRTGPAPAAQPGTLGDTGPGGGAISTSGGAATVTVQDSTFDGNRSSDGGQGGPLVNQAGPGGRGGDGGAILVLGGIVFVHGSTFTGNLAGNGGAGGDALATRGQGGNGGAIAVFGGTVTVTNSTFSANAAGGPGQGPAGGLGEGGGGAGAIAGGLGPNAQTVVTYSTFAGNLRGPDSTQGNAVSGVSLGGALLADAAPACSFITGTAPSLVPAGDASCGGFARQGDAALGPLAGNGGPTRTMLPGEGSAAIDLTPTCLADLPFGPVDQRGVLRPQRGGCDVGAVEVAPPPPGPVINPNPGPPVVPAGGAVLSGLRVTPERARPRALRRVTFTLSDPARLVVTVRRAITGRRVGVRCVAVRRAPRSAPRCTRTVTLTGSIARSFAAGAGRLRFAGVIGGAVLPPGAYVLAVRVVGGATVSRPFVVSG